MNRSAQATLEPSLTERVVEALEGGVIVLDSAQRILAWNRWMVSSSGISAARAIGHDLTAVFPTVAGTRLWTAIEDAIQMGVSSLLTHGLNQALLPLRYRDGRALLHSVAVRALAGSHDAETLCLIQVTDVTASVQRERMLRERRDARHRAVVDTAADAIITTDLDGIICWMNPAGERQFGYAASELEGENIALLLGDGAAGWIAAAGQGDADRTAFMGATGRRRDGALIELELSLSRWQSGGRPYATGILRDVTERRQEQERLRQHNKRALLLAQTAARLLAATDARAAVHDLFTLIAGPLRLDAYFHYALKEGSNALALAAYGGVGEEDARTVARLANGDPVCSEVALGRKAVDAIGIQASSEPRLASLKQLGLDSYLCTPLMAGDTLLGTLGFGRRAPIGFDEDERRFLRTICHYVAMAQERLSTQAALRASEERLRLAVEGTGMATWDLDLVTGRAVWSRHHFLLLGYEVSPAGVASWEMWLSRVHPEDRATVEAEWARARRDGGVYRVNVRVLRADDGTQRWIEAYGRFMSEGSVHRFIGVLFDVTDRKVAEEHQRLLMREVDHRAKNALAVVRSVLRLTRADDPKRFAEAVEGRVAALARAHTLLAEDLWTGAELRAVVEQELAAYRGGRRVVIGGAPVRLVADAVQPLSMALHELATNAAKYGALSGTGGRVEVSWRMDAGSGPLRLRWAEYDGPPILAPPERRGFGSTLVETVVHGQLRGRAEMHWETSGLVCEIQIAPTKIVREATPGTPRAAQAAEAGQADLAPPGISLRGRRVLVVEDEPVVAMELREVLTRLGCRVLGPVGTLQAALDLAAGGDIDIGVLDVNLHGQTSYSLADLLAERGVPVVYTTGYGELPDGRATRDGNALLRKPVSDDDLEAALRDVLASKQASARSGAGQA